MSIIGHYSLSTEHLPPAKNKHLIEYWMASNGVFVRAKREGLEAVIPVCSTPLSPLKMLCPLRPDIRLAGPRVSQELVLEMFMQSLNARTPEDEPAEILFHLYYQEDQWQVSIPDQKQSRNTVQSKQLYGISTPVPLIDLHSHHEWESFFSPTDTEDETGCRIYAVWGSIFTQPVICVRVGIYGHFYPIRATEIFDLPPIIVDGYDTLVGGRRGWL